MPKAKKTKNKDLIELIVKAAEQKQAINIKTLDISKTSSLVDVLILCSADSVPQLRAIEQEIDKQLRKHKIKGIKWEGLAKSGWMVLDLGNIVIHLMGSAERDYYNLEELWEKDAIIYHY